jgi:tetratricopeptide (TPR) repeat protein
MENERQRNWLVGLVLFLGTLVLYWPATVFSYVNFDDPWYVFTNPDVLKGLSWPGILWTFTSVEPSNWHPLTLISHMTDCSLYGVFPGGHHLTSILWHATNAVLLWGLLKRLTGLYWPSALAAALFAWHPLNVESVAWIAERKNVLSTFFFILTVWAYVAYAENRKSVKCYFLALLLFALGLASKSMLVTLPCVLLLLDYWPLKRFSAVDSRIKSWWPILLEKIPFFLLTLADSVVTCVVQKSAGAVQSLTLVPLEYRLLNVPVAYATYLAKTFWPVNLCVFHPFPETLQLAASIISLVILSAVTFLAWRWKTKFPWLLVGWFWFLGTLVPVIGLVQVGAQGWADRYAYLPLMGIFMIMAGAIHQCWMSWPQFRALLAVGVSAYLGFCLVRTGRQVMFWQDSITLFSHVVRLNPEDATSHNMLGRAFASEGRQAESIKQYVAAVRLRSEAEEMHQDLGRALFGAGRYAEAEIALADALARWPDNLEFHNLRGVALMLEGKPAAAQMEFSRAVTLKPDDANAWFNLGKAWLTLGQNQAAITNLTTALRLQPDWPQAWQNLARAQSAVGNQTHAIASATRALKMAQTNQDTELVNQLVSEIKAYQNALSPQSSAAQKN